MGARRKEQLLAARKVRTLHTEVGSEMSRISAELGKDMKSSHWREQQEHRPALAAWANCPGAESSVAGSANLPAPMPRPSDLRGLICMAQAQGPGPRAWLCVQGEAEVWKDREHTLSSIWFLLTSTGLTKHLD